MSEIQFFSAPLLARDLGLWIRNELRIFLFWGGQTPDQLDRYFLSWLRGAVKTGNWAEEWKLPPCWFWKQAGAGIKNPLGTFILETEIRATLKLTLKSFQGVSSDCFRARLGDKKTLNGKIQVYFWIRRPLCTAQARTLSARLGSQNFQPNLIL